MIRFGTGGWRAVIGDDFTRYNIERVAQGLCDMISAEFPKKKRVVLGHDRRFLSEDAAKWIAGVLCANGIPVEFISRSAPTPLVMFKVKDQRLDFGVEVTASHNPPAYNGIKIVVKEGRDAPVALTARLEEYIEKASPVRLSFEEAEKTGLVEIPKAPFNGFLDSIISKLDMDAIRGAGLRILFDSMHGSGTFPLMTVLCTARCTVDIINSNKDAWFGGNNPAPGYAQLRMLRGKVEDEKYDLGIAVDGDGDRIGIVDPTGEYLSANSILCMLYWYLHEYRGWRGPVVRNLATTHMLDRIAGSFGEKCYEVPVGFKYVSEKMDEVDAVLGGESSGGLTVRGHINGKDSIYAASLFVEMLAATGKTPKQIMDGLTEKYGRHVMVEDNFGFSSDDRARIDRLLMEEKRLPDFGGLPVAKVGYTDGCKVTFEDDSFVICRFSGTEPLLRIFAEAESEEKAKFLIKCMKEFCAG